MPYYLLLSRSITHAQRMSSTLEKAGITARFFRPPMGLTDRGCSYAVRIGAPYLQAALARLRANGMRPIPDAAVSGGRASARPLLISGGFP